VRAVATNTLRVARNAPEFLLRAEDALGFPIEVIAGREEARLIYVGVAHTLPDPGQQQLVVDIGGGSTEFIIGRNFEPLQLESLYMGCVSFSMRYFPDGAITRGAMKEAVLAARREMERISHVYRETGWDLAVGSSGSAKALCDVLELNGLGGRGGISREGLEKLRQIMFKAGHVERLQLEGLRPDRLPVFAGGVAIMAGLFEEFDLDHMVFSDGALRLGVLYDLLGRYHRHDLREATVQNFMQRYQVDAAQARRVADAAGLLLKQVPSGESLHGEEQAELSRNLEWAALLHEIGLSVAHSGYHKHSAYILANADMPGFSRMAQGRLSRLVLAHRGKLERLQGLDPQNPDWLLILCLRLAAILFRARVARDCQPLQLVRERGGFTLELPQAWLHDAPLTAASLYEEEQQWARVGKRLRIRLRRSGG